MCAEIVRALELRKLYAIPDQHDDLSGRPLKFVPLSKEDPFGIRPEDLPPRSSHVYHMVDGVMAVFPDAAARDAAVAEQAAAARSGNGVGGFAGMYVPPATATEFFSELNHLCKARCGEAGVGAAAAVRLLLRDGSALC